MTNRCSTCSAPTVWITRDDHHVLACPRPVCPGHDADATQLTPTKEPRPVTVLSARACAALARRHVDQHPGITRTALISWLCQVGADTERANRGIELAVACGWLERNGDTLTLPREQERAA
jgi:hypothetical protein